MPLKVKHMNLSSCWKRGGKKSTSIGEHYKSGQLTAQEKQRAKGGCTIIQQGMCSPEPLLTPVCRENNRPQKPLSAISRHRLCIRKCWILAAGVLLIGKINQQGYVNMSISKARRKGNLKSPRPFWENNHKSYRLHFPFFFCIMIKSVSSITPLRKIKGRQWGKEVHNDFH